MQQICHTPQAMRNPALWDGCTAAGRQSACWRRCWPPAQCQPGRARSDSREVERQVLAWVRSWFHFPQTATGLFVTGTSMANLIAVLGGARRRARHRRPPPGYRRRRPSPGRLYICRRPQLHRPGHGPVRARQRCPRLIPVNARFVNSIPRHSSKPFCQGVAAPGPHALFSLPPPPAPWTSAPSTIWPAVADIAQARKRVVFT